MNNINDLYKLIGKNIKELRIKNMESQEKFAERIDKSRGFISHIESDVDKGISIDTLFNIAQEYNIDIRDLFNGYEEFMKQKTFS